MGGKGNQTFRLRRRHWRFKKLKIGDTSSNGADEGSDSDPVQSHVITTETLAVQCAAPGPSVMGAGPAGEFVEQGELHNCSTPYTKSMLDARQTEESTNYFFFSELCRKCLFFSLWEAFKNIS